MTSSKRGRKGAHFPHYNGLQTARYIKQLLVMHNLPLLCTYLLFLFILKMARRPDDANVCVLPPPHFARPSRGNDISSELCRQQPRLPGILPTFRGGIELLPSTNAYRFLPFQGNSSIVKRCHPSGAKSALSDFRDHCYSSTLVTDSSNSLTVLSDHNGKCVPSLFD